MKRWDALLARLPDGVVSVVEVGVWDGRMSARLIERPDLILYMVDRWQPPAEDDSYYDSGSEIARKPASDYAESYDKAQYIASRSRGRATIMRMESLEAAATFKDSLMDCVFIDADHSYEGVARDIRAWLPKVKPGGWIGGHDYDHPDQGEVKRAVDEIFDSVELDGNRTWWRRVL